MNHTFLKALAFTAFCFLLPASLSAQTEKKVSSIASLYVISAKAGGVNFVSGKVTVARADKKSGNLVKGDTLEIGDKVSTGTDGKVEILLNPGSFLRLAENSEFEFVSTSLDDLQVKVNRGSAIFEIITEKTLQVAISTPKAKFQVIKSGVYRVDVLGDGTAKLEVNKGKINLENQTAAVKGGQSTVIGDGQVAAVTKFDKNDKDNLDVWSKDRAKELAKINARLMARAVNVSLMSSFSQNVWNANSGFGLWVRDPWSQTSCFLPFGYGWNSPYGYGYTRDVYNTSVAPRVYDPNQANTYNPNMQNGSQNGQSQNNNAWDRGAVNNGGMNNGSMNTVTPVMASPGNADMTRSPMPSAPQGLEVAPNSPLKKD